MTRVFFKTTDRRFALEVGGTRHYAAALSSTQFNNENVAALYRFTLLLRGGAKLAEQTLVATLTECASQIEQIRNEKNRMVFVVRKLHERCAKADGKTADESPGDETSPFVRRFSAMSEPERSAIALFYLDLFPAREIASLLGMSFDDLSDVLENGREELRRSGAVQVANSQVSA